MEGKKFKIRLEDKAAFISRLKKQGIGVSSTDINDDELNGCFDITFDDPQEIEIVNSILKSSPKINDVHPTSKKITKTELDEMIISEFVKFKKEFGGAKKKL